MFSPNRLANTFSGQKASLLFFTNPGFANTSQVQRSMRDDKMQVTLRSTSIRNSKSQKIRGFEKISWSNTKAILRVGEEYCKKIVVSEGQKAEKTRMKKEKILRNNEIVEGIKDEENRNLALKISKLHEEFYNKVRKVQQDALWKVSQDKAELVLKIQKSSEEARDFINDQSTKLTSKIFPKSFNLKPPNPKYQPSLINKTQVKIHESLKALSKTSPKVNQIKSKLIKNI